MGDEERDNANLGRMKVKDNTRYGYAFEIKDVAKGTVRCSETVDGVDDSGGGD